MAFPKRAYLDVNGRVYGKQADSNEIRIAPDFLCNTQRSKVRFFAMAASDALILRNGKRFCGLCGLNKAPIIFGVPLSKVDA